MRTTLSIDDDLAKAIEQVREEKGLSLREVVNRLLRRGLLSTHRAKKTKAYNGPVYQGRLRAGIDPKRLNQLADEVEIESFLK